MVLRALNPTGTGKLALFETNYGTSYEPVHYLVFILLGVAGGLFGGTFCKLNFHWGKWFRKHPIIKNYPVLEVSLVVLATALLQYPNPATREPGDIIIKNLLLDCRGDSSAWVCQNEKTLDDGSAYIGWLIYGTLAKLVLTVITFGVKVPSGIIIPALDAGAFFGRLVGQGVGGISPGIFAMVGAASFLAGVSRMTISLCVIMFEVCPSQVRHNCRLPTHLFHRSSQANSNISSPTCLLSLSRNGSRMPSNQTAFMTLHRLC